MKKIRTILILIMALMISLPFLIFSQAPDFNWSIKGSGTLNDQGMAVAVDAFDNVYVTGQFFSSSLSFPNSLTISMAGGTGNCDYFLAKFDKDGKSIWGVKGGGTLTDRGYGIAFDHHGNVLVTGHFFGSAVFGSHTLVSSGNLDAFTAKYDTAGNIIWIKEGKSVSQVSTRAVACDAQGNAIITGYYGSSSVDSVRFGNIKVITNGQRDIFVVKYDNSGDALWGKTAGGLKSNEQGNDVAVDANGNIYVTGVYFDTASFAGTTLYGAGSEIFLSKYSPDGDLLWVKSAGGLKTDNAYAVTIDQQGNVCIAGSIDSAGAFGSTNILTSGGTDAFIAKYDTDGNLIWVKTGGGTGSDSFNDITIDIDGNITGAGYFNGPASFGSLNLAGIAGDDICFVQLDKNGNFIWAKQAAGADNDRALASAQDAAGNIIAAGYFKSWVKFDSDSLNSAGVEDVFITKLGHKVVPVELTSFTAVYERGMVELKWTTASEVNNYGFEIERSIDGQKFKNIGFVKGFGTTSEKHYYSITDPGFSPGINYYRLKQVDLDGSYTYSDIIEVAVFVPGRFSLEQNYPNPFNPETSIQFSIPSPAVVSIIVYNSLGEIVSELLNQLLNAGNHEVQFSSKELSSGLYMYVVKATGENGESFSGSKKMLIIK